MLPRAGAGHKGANAIASLARRHAGTLGGMAQFTFEKDYILTLHTSAARRIAARAGGSRGSAANAARH